MELFTKVFLYSSEKNIGGKVLNIEDLENYIKKAKGGHFPPRVIKWLDTTARNYLTKNDVPEVHLKMVIFYIGNIDSSLGLSNMSFQQVLEKATKQVEELNLENSIFSFINENILT